MIAAIDWVVQHRNDPGFNIRVLSLSYGTDSTQWYGVDPLAFAVEQACKRGHPGRGRGGERRLLAPGRPADEPGLRPVRPRGRRGRLEGDARPRATTRSRRTRAAATPAPARKSRDPDLVAPGSHIVRACAPRARTSTQTYGGSGFVTSRSSAAAAPRRRRRSCPVRRRSCSSSGPAITPDQLKPLLCGRRRRSRRLRPTQGKGELDLARDAVDADAARGAERPVLDRHGLARRLARLGEPRRRRRHALRREGHLRDAVRLGRDGAARVGAAAPGRAASGTAAPGRAARWSGSSWSGSSWSGSSLVGILLERQLLVGLVVERLVLVG